MATCTSWPEPRPKEVGQVKGAQARLLRVPETLPREVLEKTGALEA